MNNTRQHSIKDKDTQGGGSSAFSLQKGNGSIAEEGGKRAPFSMQPFLRVSNTLQKSVADAIASTMAGGSLPRIGEGTPGIPIYSLIEDRLLPAFTGLGFSGTVEEMNMLVRQWIASTSQPTVLHELNTFLKTGMVLLAAKLNSEPDDNLPARAAEVWSSCYCKVLPTLESAFLPLRQDVNFTTENGVKIDIRKIILVSFRTVVIWPMKARFIGVFQREFTSDLNNVTDVIGKLTQMFSTLASLSVPDRIEHQAGMRQLLQSLRKAS